jgi:DNA-binding response OmpR family regulator
LSKLSRDTVPNKLATTEPIISASFPSTVSSLRSPLILVVEDNTDLRTYIRGNLQNAYRIDEARDGAEGFKSSLDKMPELIISDVMMPVMDGFKLCKKLKTDERTSHIPVILLTARAEAADKISGLETGADDYLTKPFDTKELQVRVKNLIDQRRRLREKFNRDILLQPREIACSSYDERFLQRVMAIIEQHLEDPDLKLATLIKEIGMSRKQLYRKLHALTNQSANRFIRSLRLKRAAGLLQQQYGNIAEVAFKVGFNNPAYFAECFRKQFGTLPSEYGKT